MNRKYTLALALAIALTASAQQETPATADIDWSEDSTEIVTIADIIKVQQRQTSRYATESHFEKVWGRRSFVNLSYNTGKLTPKNTMNTGMETLHNGLVAPMTSDWGAALQYGRSYRLHKKPIANIACFCVDYTGIDLGVNHYKAEGNGKMLFDSSKQFKGADGDDYFFTPWNLEKYEVSYAMTLGPSVTIAPFTLTNSRGLHYLKVNAYYHIGYHASLLFMSGDDDNDVNQSDKAMRDKMDNATKIDWGHGLTHSFGVGLSWKAIGVGYEHRARTLNYKSMATSVFGKEKYKFDVADNRVYLQIRM